MTQTEVAELIAMNFTLYKLGAKPVTDAELATMVNVWHWHLKEFDSITVKTAFLRANRVCKFPIQPADIFEQLQAMAEEKSPAGTLWASFYKTARKIAANAQCYHYTLRMPDGKTQGEHYRAENRNLFNALPQEAKQYAGSMMSLIEIGSMDSTEAERFERPRFEKSVREFRASPDGTKQLLGLRPAPAVDKLLADQNREV